LYLIDHLFNSLLINNC